MRHAPRVALVHEWLDNDAGSEKVLAQFASLYPEAPIFVIAASPDFVARTPWLCERTIHTSFIQRLPGGARHFRAYLPLMPFAIEQFDLSAYDLVISSSHAVAKGVILGPDQTHVCYLHSPMRYAWDLQHQVLRESGLARGIRGWLVRWLLYRLRFWDVRSAIGVDHLIANSRFVARRCQRIYGRVPEVLNPPVDTGFFVPPPPGTPRRGFVAASRHVPYKRLDVIVRAFASLPQESLTVIGEGPQTPRLKQLATANVTFLGRVSDAQLRDSLQQAEAFVFAAEEDFGILPVEAMACGTPVIAFGKGGIRDSVVVEGPEATGLFFPEQTPDAVVAAVQRFRERQFSPDDCRSRAERFSVERFRRAFQAHVDTALARRWQAQEADHRLDD